LTTLPVHSTLQLANLIRGQSAIGGGIGNDDPDHPFDMGVVASSDYAAGTCAVYINGSTTQTLNVVCLTHVVVSPGDKVLLLKFSTSWIVIGSFGLTRDQIVAQAYHAGDSAAVGGFTNFLGAPTFTAKAGRRYKVTISWGGTTQVGAGEIQVQIWADYGAGAAQKTLVRTNVAAGSTVGGTYVWTDVPGAVSVTYSLRTFTNATSAQLQFQYEIIVEDDGPA
jgi:hypothetical protein